MKMKYKSALWSLAVGALALVSCSGDAIDGPVHKGVGSVSLFGLEVTNAEKVVSDTAGASRAAYDVSDYIVDFYRSGEDAPVQTYVYGDMPGAVELPVGTYVAKVRSHDVKSAEWEKPYFTGESAPFEIHAGQITEVDPVRCVFSSLKVSVKFGPRLKEAAGTDVKVTIAANENGNKLEFGINETRAGYFADNGAITLVATFTGTVKGHYEEGIVKTYTDVSRGQHRVITYELGTELPKPNEPSGSVSNEGINLDISYTDEPLNSEINPGGEDIMGGDDEPGKLPDIPGSGGGEDPNPPTPPATDPITFGGTLEDGKTYINTETPVATVIINCAAGCKDVVVKIDSQFLSKDELQNAAGLNDEFSLTDSQYFTPLSDLGLPYGDAVVNQKKIDFDISMFMILLGTGKGKDNTFTLTVTDNDNNTRSITFTISVPA